MEEVVDMTAADRVSFPCPISKGMVMWSVAIVDPTLRSINSAGMSVRSARAAEVISSQYAHMLVLTKVTQNKIANEASREGCLRCGVIDSVLKRSRPLLVPKSI